MIIDLDIRIFKISDGYRVTAQAPESGLAEAELDRDALFAPDFQEKLTQVREEPFTTNQALFREIGDTLFRALFRGQVQDLYFALYSQRIQGEENTSLRLRLNVHDDALELAKLPWEFMHHHDVFLATQINTLLTRQLLDLEYGDIETLRVEDKPRTLIVIPEVGNLDTAREEEVVTQALDAAQMPYHVLKGRVTRQALDDALAQESYAILHFIGHGAFEEDADGVMHGSLRLNAAGEDLPPGEDEDWIPEVELQSLLGNHKSLKLVVLNGCEMGEVASRPEGEGFWGVAPALLRAGVPAVVAMQYPIRDDVAIQFAETFYRRLCTGKWAGHVDYAVTLARNACFLAFPDDRGFATPVLYLRSKDGVIFDFTASTTTDGHISEPCPDVPKPPQRLLYRHRNAETTTLIDRYHLLEARLQRILRQIDGLAAEVTGSDAWRLRRYKRNRDKLERELDELADVLRWRAAEACRELGELRSRLAKKEAERDALEDAGEYVPYDLKNDIFAMYERILALEDLLDEVESTYRP